MVYKNVDLYEYFGVKRAEGANANLKVLTHSKSYDGLYKTRPAILVIGGGGYGAISEREKEPIAFSYFGKGYDAFILEYSVAPIRYPSQLIEACMAVAYIRENADDYGIISNQISAIGFSAGGHLCGMLATIYGEQIVKDALGDKAKLCRPDAVILSYPVIDGGEFAHRDSFNNLCGGDGKLVEKLSLQTRVKSDTPPAFIWTTVTDELVPCENSLLIASAYRKAGVPFELHIFDEGRHGLATCTMETATVQEGCTFINPHVEKWFELSLEWLANLGFGIKIN